MDPNKSGPSWSFGGAGKSENPGSPFGQPTSNASKPGGGLFGSTINPPAASGTSSFGNTSTAGAGSIFGGTSGTSQASPFGGGGGSNVFGEGNKLSGTLFGQAGSQNNQPSNITAPPIGFSGFSTPNKPAESATMGKGQAPSLFGGTSGGGNTSGFFSTLPSNTSSREKMSADNQNTTTPTSKPTTNIFGSSTTPAGPPPSTSTGANTGSSLFSNPRPDPSNLFQKASSSSSQNVPPMAGTSGGFSGLNFGSSQGPEPTSKTQASSVLGSTASIGGSDFSGKRPAQPEGSLFQNLSKAQDIGSNKPNSSQPSSLFSLGGQSSGITSGAQSTTASMFGDASSKSSFNLPNSTQSSSSAAISMASPTAAPGPFDLFNKTMTSATSAPSTGASLFPSFGNPRDKPSATNAEFSGASVPSSTPAPASNLFSNMGKPAAASQAPDQPTTTGTAQPTASGTVNLGASTAGPSPPTQSRLKNKSMDDIITRWASDLSKYQKEFQQQAEKVANWDRMLVENSEKIQKLYGSTLEAERATTEVERQLTVVEGDQAELAHWLDYYEREVDSMISSTIGQDGVLSGPDQERERTYQLASRLSERLDDMGKDLTGMIEEINDASSTLSKNNKANDPLSQVVRVLNGHLTQLQQIDQGAAALQLKVREAHLAGQTMGLANGLSGPNSDAADGFYRSFTGKR